MRDNKLSLDNRSHRMVNRRTWSRTGILGHAPNWVYILFRAFELGSHNICLGRTPINGSSRFVLINHDDFLAISQNA